MTSALSFHNFIDMARDAVVRTFSPDSRYSKETDAVLYGKIVQLDVIAESLLSSDALTEEEQETLLSASTDLDRAFHHLADRVFPIAMVSRS